MSFDVAGLGSNLWAGRTRRAGRARVALVAVALAFACQAQEQPAPKPTPKVEQPAPTPEPPQPEPEPEPPPPPPVVPEGCKVVIDGAEGDAAVKRALINTQSGGLYDTTVADGRVITFECPPEAERKGANVIAEKQNDELVHWAGVDLESGGEGQALAAADAKPDLPEGLDEETLARLRAKWPDLSKWEEDEAKAADEQPGEKKAPSEKIPVSFSAHKLYWAELKLENKQTKKVVRLVLDPKGSKSLAPGVYALSVKLEAEGAWQDASELVIEAGKSKYSVQMLDGPPRPKVSSN